MRKTKILFRVFKKAVKKALSGQLTYKGRSVNYFIKRTFVYWIKFGTKSVLIKVKKELLNINSRYGNNLVFPNGLISGVDAEQINQWYKKNSKKVTIIIPSYNDLQVLIPCIKSIKETTNPSKVSVIIVDDYCQDTIKEELKKLEDDQIKVVFREKNGGFAVAVNTGINAANSSHDIMLLNSDTVAHPGWLEALQYGAYEFGVDTGIVGPKLLYPDGKIQSAGSFRNTEAPEWFDHYYRFQDSNYGPANIPHYCLAVTGACMYVKREFINYVGILDDKFQFAFEDVDWCLRGWNAGYRSLYFPAATLTHVESATRPKHKTISQKEKQSIDYFWEKWGKWFDDRNVRDAEGRIKIIFVLQTMGMSGGIRVVFENAERLAARGFNIEVWGFDTHGIPWEVSDSIKIRTFKNYDRLTAQLSHEEAIKVATWWETAFPVWLASVIKGIPVYFIQELETWFYPDDVVAQSTVISCYRKEFINMTSSQFNLNEVKALGLKAVAVTPGIDTSIYHPLETVKRNSDVLLAVGRTFFQKNFQFTFRAWKALGDKKPRMWLFGIEPEMSKLDQRIKYIEKPTNDEVNKLYNQATIFVQTSRHEGFSIPLLEAMAAGCPIICTDAHGNQDFCFDGKNCLMVDHDDTVALTKAITNLLNDKKLRDSLAKEGIKTAKNYEWDKIMDKAEKFFKDIARPKYD